MISYIVLSALVDARSISRLVASHQTVDLEVEGNQLHVPKAVCHLFAGNPLGCDGCNC
jgi:hypothetical protein